MDYQAIIGSRCYGLEINSSDLDILIVGTSNLNIPSGKIHSIILSKEEFISEVFMEINPHPFWMQTIYPSEFLLNNELSEYILNNRERYISANRSKIYHSYIDKASAIASMIDIFYENNPKPYAYCILWFTTLARYASGISFSEAIKPDSSTRQFLIDMRNKLVSLENAKSALEEARQSANSVSEFYNVPPDLNYLQEFRSTLDSLFDK